MEKQVVLNGLILGMEQCGAVFVKQTETEIHFNIPVPEESTINSKERIDRAKNAFKQMLNLELKIN